MAERGRERHGAHGGSTSSGASQDSKRRKMDSSPAKPSTDGKVNPEQIPLPQSLDFSRPLDMEGGDAQFDVEGQKVYASTFVLGMWSPVFKKMLDQDIKEKTAARPISITDRKVEDFLELMRVLHPPLRVDDSNVRALLPQAYEYQITTILRMCERFLLTKKPSMEWLYVAELYSLQDLTNYNIEGIEHSTMLSLHKDKYYRLLSDKTRLRYLTRKFEQQDWNLNSNVQVQVVGPHFPLPACKACGRCCTASAPGRECCSSSFEQKYPDALSKKAANSYRMLTTGKTN